MGNTELLPCPFCGSKDIFMQAGTPKVSCQISCENCGGYLETGETWDSGDRWNNRAPSKSEQGLREQLLAMEVKYEGLYSARQKIAKYEEALEFYAGNNYRGIQPLNEKRPAPIIEDRGNRAKQALKQHNEAKGE